MNEWTANTLIDRKWVRSAYIVHALNDTMKRKDHYSNRSEIKNNLSQNMYWSFLKILGLVGVLCRRSVSVEVEVEECRGGCRPGGRCQGAAAETAQKLFNRSGFANWAKHWRVVNTDWFVLNLRVAKENTIKLVFNLFIGLHNVHLGSWRLECILNKLSLSTT